MSVFAAIGRDDVARFVATLMIVFIVLIFVRIVISWVPRMPYNRFLAIGIRFVEDVTDPYLNFFRRFLPAVRIGPGALDLSPMVGTFVIIVLLGIIPPLIAG